MEMNEPTPRDAAYWQALYEEGDTGWDKGEPAPPLVRSVEAGGFAPATQVLVPGCGLGHEALFLAQQGFAVTAVDFAADAIAALAARSKGLSLEAIQRDLFGLPADFSGHFELVVEHTCFCAIPLERRPEYAAAMAAVLAAGGRFIGLFYETDRQDGPPFRTTKEHIEEHFGPHFNILAVERPADSFENRRGQEWLVHMVKP